MKFVRGFLSGILCSLLVVVLLALGAVAIINQTILNPDFVIEEFDKLDIYSVVTEQVKTNLPGEEFYGTQVLDNTIDDLDPWLRDQTAAIVRAGCAYLKGDEELNVRIPLEPVRSSLKVNLRQSILKSLPPELAGVSESQIDVYLEQVYGEIDSLVPENFELNEDSLGPEIMAQVRSARQIVSHIESGFEAMIGLAILLILLVALVHWWHAKPITRAIGIVSVIVGISFIIDVLLSRYLSPSLISSLANQGAIPFELQGKLSQLVIDIVAPLQVWGIGFLVAGIMLLVISVLFKSPDARNDLSPNYTRGVS